LPDDVTLSPKTEHAPSRSGVTPTAERKRRQRARARAAAAAAAPLMFERADWTLFIRRETLPQKAGCAPYQIGRVLLKEAVDNALDAGADVQIERIFGGYRIIDNGPGIEPDDVPRLFAVNRPLLSSKLKRLPLRGMLGNGLRVVMGAVAAYDGEISVTTRGRRLSLAVDPVTGATSVLTDERVPHESGLIVEIKLTEFDGSELDPAELSLTVAKRGQHYRGPSQPAWYSPCDLHELLQRVTPATVTVGAVVQDVFDIALDDQRRARDLTGAEIAELYSQIRGTSNGKTDIGHLGNSSDEPYGRTDGVARIGRAEIPYCVECWTSCSHISRDCEPAEDAEVLLNRSPVLTPLSIDSDSYGLELSGCGLQRIIIKSAKRANYVVRLSIITPHIRLMNDGKTPFLGDFQDAIQRAVTKAANAAYRAMTRPPKKMSIIDASWRVMSRAYAAASDNGTLPANARQIMYAARPRILALTGTATLNDNRFIQYALPDYVAAHPDECADWDVVFDDRGHFVEPHTGRRVGLGTIRVRNYVDEPLAIGPAFALSAPALYPTTGPDNRYRNVLYVEKEGFEPLLAAARIADRFDISTMSTKGMSVIAARELIDWLAPKIDRLFVLHDFDVSGFSIAGTLTTDSRRYVFKNAIAVVDLGRRLADVEALGLQSEPVKPDCHRKKTSETLRRHGAFSAEIDFLLGDGEEDPRRVELNAMTSRQFIDFIERGLIEHGVAKVIPQPDILEQHARRLIAQRLAKDALNKVRDQLAAEAAACELPGDLDNQVRHLLAEQPELSWDMALAMILKRIGR
jgi:hypothetical protein